MKKSKSADISGLTVHYLNGDSVDFTGVNQVAHRDGMIDLFNTENDIDEETNEPCVDWSVPAINVLYIEAMD